MTLLKPSPLSLTLTMPEKAAACLTSDARFKVLYGGRGAGRSWSAAKMAIAKSFERKHLFLCTRQFQKSIKDSIHRLIANRIREMGLTRYFDIQRQTIINLVTGSEFVFYGIHHNPDSIKSLEGVTITICEESEKLTSDSIDILEPTVMRTDVSEMWILFNPQEETDPVYKHYVANPRPHTYLCQMNYDSNPWFPKYLDDLRLHMARTDPDAYHHIWEGGFKSRSDAQVLSGKWVIDAFEPQPYWDGAYIGVDWGYSVDPTTLVKCWIYNNCLYIEHEVYQVGLELDQIGNRFKRVPDIDKYTIRADSARPETIAYVSRDSGLNIIAAEKGKGSVEDGVAFLRAFDKIIIHDRCKYAAQEAKLWSYKTDRLSGDVKPILEDKHNHIWDAVRYALEPIMKRNDEIGWMMV